MWPTSMDSAHGFGNGKPDENGGSEGLQNRAMRDFFRLVEASVLTAHEYVTQRRKNKKPAKSGL